MTTTTHTTTERNLAKAEILATFDHQIEELKRAKRGLSNVLLGSGFIVRVEGLCIDFAIDPETRNVTTNGIGMAHRVRRFTRADAEHLASITRNGNGVLGQAVHVCDAVAEDLAVVLSLRATVVDL